MKKNTISKKLILKNDPRAEEIKSYLAILNKDNRDYAEALSTANAKDLIILRKDNQRHIEMLSVANAKDLVMHKKDSQRHVEALSAANAKDLVMHKKDSQRHVEALSAANAKDFKKYFTILNKDNQRHIEALSEDFQRNLSAVAEQMIGLNDKMDTGFARIDKTLDSHTEMIGQLMIDSRRHTEQISEIQTDVKELKVDVKQIKTDVKVLQTDVKVLQTDVAEIKIVLAPKVDRGEFVHLENRVSVLEKAM